MNSNAIKKLIIILLIGILYQSCKNNTKEDSRKPAINDNTKEIRKETAVRNMDEKMSDVEEKEQNTPKGIRYYSSSYPHWLQDRYEDRTKWEEGVIDQRIIEFQEIPKKVAYCIYTINNGVCTMSKLVTLTKDTIIDELELERGCDISLNASQHKWKSYEKTSEVKFEVREYIEFSTPSYIGKNGYLKDGFSFDEIETKLDSTISIYAIEENGKIKRK